MTLEEQYKFNLPISRPSVSDLARVRHSTLLYSIPGHGQSLINFNNLVKNEGQLSLLDDLLC